MNAESYERFNARLSEVERQTFVLRAELEQARLSAAAGSLTPGTVGPAIAAPTATAHTTSAGQLAQPAQTGRPARARLSLEALVAGRAMQIIGLFLVLLGAAFFLKLAFDNDWIGPQGRVLLGLAVGLALVFTGARRVLPAFVFLAEGLIGLGAGILYLSLWAAANVFSFISHPVALVAMIAVTASVALLAYRRDSQRLALASLLGGYLTPLLLATETPDRIALAAYLLVLGGGMLTLAIARQFSLVETATFVGLLVYSPAFVPDDHWTAMQNLTVMSLFFAEFATALFIGARRATTVTRTQVALVTLSVLAYVLALELDLEAHRYAVGGALLALAAVLLAAVKVRSLPAALRSTYSWLSLGSVTLAIPSIVQGFSVSEALSVEAAILVAVGARTAAPKIRFAGAALFFVTGVTVAAYYLTAARGVPFWNSHVLALAIFIGALLIAIREIETYVAPFDEGERFLWQFARVAVNAAAVMGLSREVVNVFEPHLREWDAMGPRAQFGLSFLWTAYACTLFLFGMGRRDALQRWQGLALFGITILKVFTVDLSSLNVSYRILSFIILGVVLVAVLAFYQRSIARQGGVAP